MPTETISGFIKARMSTWTLEDICAALQIRTITDRHMVDTDTKVEVNAKGEVTKISTPAWERVVQPDPEPEPEPEPESEPEPEDDDQTFEMGEDEDE